MTSSKRAKNQVRKWFLSFLPLYSPIINFIRQIAQTATMDHCILWPLYPLFSLCQWSFTAPRTISDMEDEDEEKSGENRRRPRAQLRRIDKARERGGTIQELLRDHPKEACHGSPRLASVAALLPHLERTGAGAAFKHMSAFVCHRDSLRCSLARSLARLQFEPAEPGSSRGSHARILFRLLIAHTSRATLARHCLFF